MELMPPWGGLCPGWWQLYGSNTELDTELFSELLEFYFLQLLKCQWECMEIGRFNELHQYELYILW